jgi:hypothetical protein
MTPRVLCVLFAATLRLSCLDPNPLHLLGLGAAWLWGSPSPELFLATTCSPVTAPLAPFALVVPANDAFALCATSAAVASCSDLTLLVRNNPRLSENLQAAPAAVLVGAWMLHLAVLYRVCAAQLGAESLRPVDVCFLASAVAHVALLAHRGPGPQLHRRFLSSALASSPDTRTPRQ